MKFAAIPSNTSFFPSSIPASTAAAISGVNPAGIVKGRAGLESKTLETRKGGYFTMAIGPSGETGISSIRLTHRRKSTPVSLPGSRTFSMPG